MTNKDTGTRKYNIPKYTEVKNYVLYEVKDEKSHEGLIAIANRFTGYFYIEGTRFKIEHLLTTREALPLIGLQ